MPNSSKLRQLQFTAPHNGRPNAEITLLSGPRVLIISLVQTFFKKNILRSDKIPLINLLGNFGDSYIHSELRSQLGTKVGYLNAPFQDWKSTGRILHLIAEMTFFKRWGGHRCFDCTWVSIHLYPLAKREITENLGRVK
jgi:hypothetical protein